MPNYLFPPINASVYFGELFNQHHLDIFILLTTCLSPVAFVMNMYGLYAIGFHTASYLKVLQPHLLFHQITLTIVDFIVFDIVKPVFVFPILAGFPASFLETWDPHWTLLFMMIGTTTWALTCSSALQILLFKHQNLWPPGSRWTLSPRLRFLFCAYLNGLAAFSFSIPLFINGLHFMETKQILKSEEGLDCLSELLDRPSIIVMNQGNTSFIVFAAALTHVAAVFAAALVAGSISTYYGLRKQRSLVSQKTYRMQKKYLHILLVQLFIPLCFSFFPGLFTIYIMTFRTWVPLALNLVLASLLGLHGMFATVLCIFLNDCYRKPFLKLFTVPFWKLKTMCSPSKVDDIRQLRVLYHV